MIQFPDIMLPDFPLEEEDYFRQIETEFEAGYVQSRRASTIPKNQWMLKWKSMPETDFQVLRTFWRTNLGKAFEWTHPVENLVYKVRFTGSRLKSQLLINQRRSVTLSLQEAPGA